MSHYRGIKHMKKDLVEYLTCNKFSKDLVSSLHVSLVNGNQNKATICVNGMRSDIIFILDYHTVEDIRKCVCRFIEYHVLAIINNGDSIIILGDPDPDPDTYTWFYECGILLLSDVCFKSKLHIYKLEHLGDAVLLYSISLDEAGYMQRMCRQYQIGNPSHIPVSQPNWFSGITSLPQMVDSPMNSHLTPYIVLLGSEDVFSGEYLWISNELDQLHVNIPFLGWMPTDKDWFYANFNKFSKEITEEFLLYKNAGA